MISIPTRLVCDWRALKILLIQNSHSYKSWESIFRNLQCLKMNTKKTKHSTDMVPFKELLILFILWGQGHKPFVHIFQWFHNKKYIISTDQRIFPLSSRNNLEFVLIFQVVVDIPSHIHDIRRQNWNYNNNRQNGNGRSTTTTQIKVEQLTRKLNQFSCFSFIQWLTNICSKLISLKYSWFVLTSI